MNTHRIRSFALAALPLAAAAAMAQGVAAPGDDTQQVVVTATRYAMLAIDAPASLSVVSQRDIAARGADNVLEAVRGEAGISLHGRAVGGRKVVSLRGLEARHTLVLVDGRRIGASAGVIGASDFEHDWVAVEDIERIEVIRGPLAALYGSEALGGVINIITREAGQGWRFGALAEGSHADGGRGGSGERASLRADGPLGEAFGGSAVLRAGAATRRSGAVASAADARLSELEGIDKRDGWIGLGWRSQRQRIDADHREGREERRALARERGGQRRFHETFNDIERTMSSLAWQADWGSGAAAPAASTQLRAYRASIAVANRRSAGVAVNVPQRIVDDVLEGQGRLPLAAHTLTAGSELRNESLDDPGLPGGRGLAQHRALFVQDEVALAADMSLTVGARYDRHQLYGHAWSPRAYLVWRVAPGWTVKGGASHGFLAPNLKQIVPGARAEGPNLFFGNPALKPETSDGVEAGVGFARGGVQAQATLFEQRVRELIDVRLVAAGAAPGTGSYVYENLARARLRGAEFAASFGLPAGFNVSAQYTHLDASSGSGQRLDRRPRHAAALRLDWSRGPWRAGASVEYSAGQRLPSTTVGAPSQPVPDVTLAGAQFTRSLGGGLEATLAVSNLGDVRLAEKSPLFTQAEAPRRWRLALRGSW